MDSFDQSYKRVLNFVQQVFFLLSTEGSLVIIRAYPALNLGVTPSQETGTSPPRCLLLENRLYIRLYQSHNLWVLNKLLNSCYWFETLALNTILSSIKILSNAY